METTFEDDAGRIMVGDHSGGTGGGVTGYATRPATHEEKGAFLQKALAAAEAEIEAAKVAFERWKEKHEAHFQPAPVVAEEPAEEEPAPTSNEHHASDM